MNAATKAPKAGATHKSVVLTVKQMQTICGLRNIEFKKSTSRTELVKKLENHVGGTLAQIGKLYEGEY